MEYTAAFALSVCQSFVAQTGPVQAAILSTGCTILLLRTLPGFEREKTVLVTILVGLCLFLTEDQIPLSLMVFGLVSPATLRF